MLSQSVRQRVGAPEKHAAVPEIIAGAEKLTGRCQVRLFREAAHAQGMLVGLLPDLYISVAGFRTHSADAEYDNIFSGGGNLDSAVESRAVCGGIGDYVVGGKQTEHGVGFVTKQKKRR